MSDFAIRVDGVSKLYQLGELERYRTLRDSLTDAITAPFRRLRRRAARRNETPTLWALKDISFEVKRGEVIGIIGRNGAGKSTLLKILSRITEPTSGHAEIRGRVGSLLEVGTGFHPELSGRENILLNGAILGMRKTEILRKFDEIVAFAEVEKFIDTPVKHYSSGMYVRLAFAVAAHLETENLIVDEVLAVGDAEFQKKCLGKMESSARDEGRTVLFVSHNMSAVQALCSRVVRLQDGSVRGSGSPHEQIAAYLGAINSAQEISKRGPVALGPVLELDLLSFTPNPVASGKPLDFVLSIGAREDTVLSDLAILIYSVTGARVAILDLRSRSPIRLVAGQTFRAEGTICSFSLVEGDYRIGLYVDCSQYWRDYTDLVSLTVLTKARPGDVVPHPPHYRGTVDFDYVFTTSHNGVPPPIVRQRSNSLAVPR